MRGKLFLFVFLVTSITGFSQVGIGTTLPSTSSQLEVTATNKGILIPRIALTGTSDAVTIANGNVTSLLVYNTATASDVVPGFYYWNGSKWSQVLNKDDISALDLTNDAFNNNTVRGAVELNTKSDGTTLRDANTEFVIQDAGNVGVGTATPNASALIDINAANKGMLIPRVSLQNTLDNTTITNGNVTSLLVYNEQTVNDVVAGFYYWMGTKWTKIINSDDILAALNTVDLRLVGTNNHITKDAGSGGTGISAGTGIGNILLGKNAGNGLTNGSYNFIAGQGAGEGITTNRENIIIGLNAGRNVGSSLFRSVLLGSNAGLNANMAEFVAIGSYAGYNNTGWGNVFTGPRAGFSNTTGNLNTMYGYEAGQNSTTTVYSTFLGFRAGKGNGGINTGNSNTFLGYQTGFANTTGASNSSVGFRSGEANTTGAFNSSVGAMALVNNTTGRNNVAIGVNAGFGASLGVNPSDNVMIGYRAAQRIESGRYNAVIGAQSAYNISTGQGNSFLGDQSGNKITTGSHNTVLGRYGGSDLTTGNDNIAIGYQTRGFATGNQNIVIGYRSQIDNAASNQLNIGNLIYGTGVNSSTGTNVSNGSIGLGTAAPKANAILDMSDVTNKGVLMPKVALTSTTDVATVAINTIGSEISKNMLVYNTATVADVTEGYYYWNGAATGGKWERVVNISDLRSNMIFSKDINTNIISNVFDNAFGVNGSRISSFVIGSDRMDDNPSFGDDNNRMFFNKDKGAFRAGQAGVGTRWDDVNVGSGSVGFGIQTIASGIGSFSGGFGTNSSGMGAFTFGFSTQASGMASTAFGISTRAIGNASFTVGDFTTAETYGQTTIGYYNTIQLGNTTAAVATERLFVIGNGTGSVKSDALTVLKNGNTTINGSLVLNSADGGLLLPKVALTGTADATTITAGNVEGLMVYNTATVSDVTPGFYSWNGTAWAALTTASTPSVFTTASGITSNAPGTIATDNFIFGSTQIDDGSASTDDDYRMMFLKSKFGAFRAGATFGGTYWDNANIGNASAAFGVGSIASGTASFATGTTNNVSGDGAGAIGQGNTVSGNAGFSTGGNNNVSANQALALGVGLTSESHAQLTIGRFNTPLPGNTNSYVATDRLFVIGNGNASVRSDALTVLKNGNTTINGSLALNSTDGGLLLPKVALTGTADATTITAGNVEGLMVYNTATVAGEVAPGFYSWNGTKWENFINSSNLLDAVPLVYDSSTGAITNTFPNSTSPTGRKNSNFVLGSNSLNDLPSTNDNKKLAFYRNKAAFRVGESFNDTWDEVNVGQHSFGIGFATRATGNYSFAGGAASNSTGNTSFSFGFGPTASGDFSTALGQFTTSETYTQTTFGYHNTAVAGNATTAVATDRLFVIGNGTNAVKSDALTLLKNGNMTIAGTLTTAGATYPDYVFENYVDGKSTIDKTYTFKTLTEVESFIKANKHLPGVTGIKDLKKTKGGYAINLTKLSTQTLEKVEELYLHTIAQQKKIDRLKAENEALKARLSKIEAVLGIK